MNRFTLLAVLVVLTGCNRAVQTSFTRPPSMAIAPDPDDLPPTADAIAAVEQALKNTTVRFAFDQDQLTHEAQQSLQHLARVLRKHPNVKITVAGNCDERGTEEYNFLLAQRRAEAAAHYLWVLGVRERQLETISYGAELPLSLEGTEEAWALNRRDDLTVKRVTPVASIAP
ncbi:MAG: OmpA family protein [Candidatus Hydrogenedentes bacterium]|nr:OmpA family protein [Candidatus Hydrogenedentota bacterium]MBL8921653.1 OmpA family protein [Myxococcaceae bacterium]